MIVLVTGTRHKCRKAIVWNALDELLNDIPIRTIISGACDVASDQSVDMLAINWAKARGLDVIAVEADWKRYGRRAGPIRNQLMIDKHQPDLVVRFQGDAGTRDMVKRAEAAGIPVLHITRSLHP